jgi:hypothetical protein
MEEDKGAGNEELDLSAVSMEAIDLIMDEAAEDSAFGEILRANRSRPEVVKRLYEHSRTPDDVRAQAANLLRVPAMAKSQVEELRKREQEEKEKVAERVKKEGLMRKIQALGVGEKIKLAQTGNKSIRTILLNDTNKLVVLTALENPKITEPEIEAIARNRSIIEEAMRKIANNREWMKSYSIMTAVITNPKTPSGLAMNYVKYLKKKDLMLLSKNKGVPDAVRNAALRLVKTKQI